MRMKKESLSSYCYSSFSSVRPLTGERRIVSVVGKKFQCRTRKRRIEPRADKRTEEREASLRAFESFFLLISD